MTLRPFVIRWTQVLEPTAGFAGLFSCQASGGRSRSNDIEATLCNYHRKQDRHATLSRVGKIEKLKVLSPGTWIWVELKIKGHSSFKGKFYRNRTNCYSFYSNDPIENFPFDETFTPLNVEIKRLRALKKAA